MKVHVTVALHATLQSNPSGAKPESREDGNLLFLLSQFMLYSSW